MKIFFTADLHLSHANIIKYCNRPFSNVADMDRTLRQKWNERVGPRDRVYVLGDFTMGNADFAKRNLSALNGEKYLIVGNHDRIKSEAKAVEVGFAWAGKNLMYQLGPYLVALSHYPYTNDMAEIANRAGLAERQVVDKFAHRRLKDKGNWLLHGHCHTAWKVRGRQVNVGVDQWDFAPVSREELIAFIKAQSKL